MRNFKVITVVLLGLTLFSLVADMPTAKADPGTAIGGILGALGGAAMTRGGHGGKVKGAIIGGAIGAIVGHEVSVLNKHAKQKHDEAQQRCYEYGKCGAWSDAGVSGKIVIIDEGYSAERPDIYCRTTRSDFYADGGWHHDIYHTCRGYDSRWYEVDGDRFHYRREGYRHYENVDADGYEEH